MAYDHPGQGTLKRKRRRRADKAAISARLTLDGTLQGERALLSRDLLEDLYPHLVGDRTGESLFVAVAPWNPDPSPSARSWVILPVRLPLENEKPLQHSTVRFPAGARGTRSLVELVQEAMPNRVLRQNTVIEVRVSDVVPLGLETVFVSVDTQSLDRIQQARKRYGGGHDGHANGLVRGASTQNSETRRPADETASPWSALVREGLSSTEIVHSGDFVPLSLTHPTTRTPAPPAKILACEPVSQGLLTPSTRIVLLPAQESRKPGGFGRNLLSPRLAESDEDLDDSTAESFYSAVDTPAHISPAKPIVTSKSATDFSNSDATLFDDTTEDSNLSSDEDDLISLAKPSSALGNGPSGTNSAISSSTRRPFSSGPNGVSTPGSVFSHMSGSTIRGGAANRSKVFRAQGLMQPIPIELLYPKPAVEEDEEARVYIESSALARLGCFSGDWVRLEGSEIYPFAHLSAFAGLDARSNGEWRPVKVYGLPESMARKPARYQLNPKPNHQRNGSTGSRRGSIASVLTTSAPVAGLYLSPVLLANLGEPSHVSISPLPKQRSSLKRPMSPRPGSVSTNSPPTAGEVTLRKVITPLSGERALSNLLFTNLKDHFEQQQRIVKSGDLVAISVDETLGRSVYDGEEGESASLLAQWAASESKYSQRGTAFRPASVAWFTVESVLVTPSEDGALQSPAEAWGSAAIMDTIKTTLRQSGDDRRKLPSTSGSSWPFYLGARRAAPVPSSAQASLPEPPKPYVSLLQRRLKELVSVSVSPRAVHLGIPPLAVLLTSTQRSIGKSFLVQRVCADLGLHYFGLDAYDLASEGSGTGTDTGTQGLLEARCERALDCGPQFTVLCIKHIEQLASDRVAKSLEGVLAEARVLVATTTDIDKVPDSLRGLFTHELEMSAPDEAEREGILSDLVASAGVPVAPEVELSGVAVKTAALVAGDLVDVVDRAITARDDRLNKMIADAKADSNDLKVTLKDVQLAGGTAASSLMPADFDAAVDLARKNFADSIGAPKIPNVQWSDVGGLSHVKDAVVETIQLPLSRPELFAKGLKKRSGILFYGPPGTGKTLLAKAIATEFSLNFFSVKGPELLNMYIGESEANVRRVFQRARDARPCVVFFDELDSVAPKRGNQGDSGGVMDRIVSQLLAELDGMSDGDGGGGGVFVIGATNRPDLLDQALLRPGRFDKMLYLGISDTHEKQETILRALTRKFTLDPSLSLARVAETLPFTFTGADLYALCSDAMLKAVTRSAKLVDDKLAVINEDRIAKGQMKASVAYFFDHFATEESTQVSVVEEDFLQAKGELVPSVSIDELRHYEQVRDSFEGSKKKADGQQPSQQQRRDQGQGQNGGSGAVQAARGKMMEAFRRGSEAMSNGKKTGKGSASNDHESDDDFVIRTDNLSLNGVGGKGKGKGKGKSAFVGGASAHGDNEEDLYD